jgi:hypothetical protein
VFSLLLFISITEVHHFLCELAGLIDINDIEVKLQKLSIFSLRALITIDPLDLVAAGISREDVLIIRERAIRSSSNIKWSGQIEKNRTKIHIRWLFLFIDYRKIKERESNLQEIDLAHWLKNYGLEPEILEKFKGIPMKNLAYLRRSDLIQSLGIPLLEAGRIWMNLPHSHSFGDNEDSSSKHLQHGDTEVCAYFSY